MIPGGRGRPTTMKTKNLATLYDLPPVDWDAVAASLPEGQSGDPGGPGRYTAWLATTNPDGSPHVTGVGARWDDGAWWVVSGRSARKGRNLERDPRCAISLSTTAYDVVVEGTAELPWHLYRVTPTKATALQVQDPGGATTWTFDR
jgi:hypothetical protein